MLSHGFVAVCSCSIGYTTRAAPCNNIATVAAAQNREIGLG
jgi:hypothetical protein